MKSNTIRIRIISLFIILFAGLLLSRLFFVQAVRGEYYGDLADRQYLRPSAGVFDRGSIFFQERDGKLVSVATVKTGSLLAISPALIEDPEETYRKISLYAEVNRDDFLRKASRVDDPYEEIANKIDKNTAEKIIGLGLPGVYLYKERWRFYPAGELAAHVVGFMGYKGDDYSGRYGLEKEYEETLSRGNNPSFANFFAQIFSDLGEGLIGTDRKNGEGDIILTIDSVAQRGLEDILAETQGAWSAESMGGIIMDPKTGEILAMAARPSFYPGGKQENISALTNPLVESVFEMGSIIKPLTVAAALDAKVISPSTTYNDKGSLTLNNRTISNYDGKARGVVPIQEILNQSLNTGAVFAMQQLGSAKFRDYFMGYGLGEKTDIDLPDEISGLVNNIKDGQEVEYATASYGQGIALTPIGATRALATLGNGGILVRPHVVSAVEYPGRLKEEIETEIQRRILREETSEEITRMLVRVVDEALLGGTVALPNHSVAAKTGTAQIPDSENGGYHEDKFLHSFFGYFPAYDPEFIIFMYTVNPRGARYASQTLTEPFFDLTKFLISYYQVPPDR